MGRAVAAQGDEHGSADALHRERVGADRLGAICRADGQQIRQCSASGQHLDGLVGRPVLAQLDGVVCCDVDHVGSSRARESNGSPTIGEEVHEGAAEGDEAPIGRKPCANAQHAMLSHAEAEVAAGLPLVLEVPQLCLVCEVAARQVRRAAHHLRNGRHQAREHLGGVLASRLSALSHGVLGQVVPPIVGQLAVGEAPNELRTGLAILLAELPEELGPRLSLRGSQPHGFSASLLLCRRLALGDAPKQQQGWRLRNPSLRKRRSQRLRRRDIQFVDTPAVRCVALREALAAAEPVVTSDGHQRGQPQVPGQGRGLACHAWE
mmetsp:Transcript_45342/g.115133  ORF Transcript_45342/g.115133 Transcript_45342/m.115133 type:complete len:321 (+) Transcript_45342:611-1573(+)